MDSIHQAIWDGSGAERLHQEIAKALTQIADILDDEQREQFVSMMVSGVITF